MGGCGVGGCKNTYYVSGVKNPIMSEKTEKSTPSASYPPGSWDLVEEPKVIQKSGCYNQRKSRRSETDHFPKKLVTGT